MAAGGLGGLFTLLAVLIVVAYKLLLPGKAKGLVNILLMAGVMSVYQVGSMYTLLLGNSIRWLWGAIWMDSASGSMSMFGVVLVMMVMGSAFVGAFVVSSPQPVHNRVQ